MAGKFQSSGKTPKDKSCPRSEPDENRKPQAKPEPPAPKKTRGKPELETAEPLNHEQARIQEWLKKVRFRKAVLGGVDEADVWKKIGELNTLYEAALSAERARYDALLAERTGAARPEGATEHGKVWDE